MEPEPGDMLIRGRIGVGFDVVDAVTDVLIATLPSFNGALTFAAKQPTAAVWHQLTDKRGRHLGNPTRLLPRIRR